jgi:hypothetical protein
MHVLKSLYAQFKADGSIIKDHKFFWRQKDFLWSIFTSLIFLVLSFVINHYTSEYSDRSAGNYVQDILLDNLPVFNVNFVVNEVVWLCGYFVLFLLLIRPQRIPFVIKALSLFIFIRAVSISLTHLGPIPVHSFLNRHDFLSQIAGGSDMFFSGHTGMPFLLALVFWENAFVRYVLLSFSLIFGVSMILGHLHYSIDVFAACFIAHSIYYIAKRFFTYEYKLFYQVDHEIRGGRITSALAKTKL